jgi:hypothetical protein
MACLPEAESIRMRQRQKTCDIFGLRKISLKLQIIDFMLL